MLAIQLRSVECGRGAVPDPERLAVAGEFVAVLTNETEPDAAPLWLDVKVKVTGRVLPAAIVAGSVKPVTLKSEPLTFAAETFTDPVPVFESVTVCVVLLPTTTLPKETLVGETLNKNVGGLVAVPDNVTTGGVFGALLVTVNVPLKVLAVVGANVTFRLAD